MFNGLGAGNIGDETMFLAFLDHYPMPPKSTVEVYDSSSPIIKTLPTYLRYLDWTDDEMNNKAAQSAQTVLLVGDTPVVCEWGLEWPMRALATRLRFCHSEGIPVHAVGVGVGALYEKEARKIFYDSFLPIKSWTVRSPRCRAALLDLDVPSERIAVGADLAWLFAQKQDARPWARMFWKNLGVDLSLGLLGVNTVNERWAGINEVKISIAKTLDKIIQESGIQVAFLCNETREGDFFDYAASKEIIRMMTEKAILVPNHYFLPSQMIALLSFCTLTLSQRYHFTVMSIMTDVVTLSFDRGQKMVSLLEDLDEDAVGSMDSCDERFLRARILAALNNIPAIKNRQQLAARRLRHRARNDFKFLNSLKL